MASQLNPKLYVLSAPSGSGKSTVEGEVLRLLPSLVYSVSFTTRPPRVGEIDGQHYNFVSTEKFQDMIAKGEFLEWAQVFGNYYGTGRHWVEERLAEGQSVLLDLDVVGAASVKKLKPEAVLIFMVPPDFKTLRQRLCHREGKSGAEIDCRLGEARNEIASRHIYDYLIINGDLESAVQEMITIITTGVGRKMAENLGLWANFFEEDAC